MPITVADLQVKLRADTGRTKADLLAANQALGGTADNAERQGGRVAGAFSRIGPAAQRGMTIAGGAIGAGLVAATGAAVELEDQMASVATVVPTADLDGLTDQVQELSRASGQSTTDLTAGLYDLVSAGVPAEEAMSVLSASTDLAIGGLGTTAGAADVVTSALNAYGLEADKAGGITDTFALAIQRGKVTADEIGASIANVAPIAASAGIGLEEVSAAYGVLTAKGVPAAQATTQMRAAISSLLTPNEKLNALQEQTGVNFAELAEEKGLGVALETMRQGFAANGDALAQLAGVAEADFPDALAAMQTELGLTNSDVERLSAMAGKDGAAAALQELAKVTGESESGFAGALGSVEAYQFALATTGENADAFQGQIADYAGALEGSGIAAEQAAIKQDTAAGAGARLAATFQTFMQDVGGPFVSTMGPAVAMLNNMGGAMGGLPRLATMAGGALGALGGKALPKLAGGLANVGAKLGGPLIGGLTKLGPMLASGLTGLLPMLGGAVTGLVTGIGGLFAAAIPLLVAALPVLLIGAVVAAIAVLILNPEIREAVFGFIGGILEWIGEALGKVGEFLGGVAAAVGEFFGGLLDTVTGALGAVLGAIGGFIGNAIAEFAKLPIAFFEAVSRFIGQMGEVAAAVIGKVVEFVGTVVGFYLSIPGRIIGLIGSVVGIAGRMISGFVSAVVGGVGNVVSTILGIPGRVLGVVGRLAGVAADAVSGFVGMFLGLPGKIAGIVGDAIAGAAGAVGDFLSDPLGSIGGLIPSFQEGTLSAPGGLAMLHPGEMVIPPDLSASFRRFLGAGNAAPSSQTTVQERSSETNVTVVLPGSTRPMGPEDIARPLRRLAALGSLPSYDAAG